MKAIVENPIMNCNIESMNIFVQIINEITSCITEKELRECMNLLSIRNPHLKTFFDYGFGHNHMWVKERDSKERLIFVEF